MMFKYKSSVLHLLLIIVITVVLIAITISTFTFLNNDSISKNDNDDFILYNGNKFPKLEIKDKKLNLLSHWNYGDYYESSKELNEIYGIEITNKRVRYDELLDETEKVVASGEKIDIVLFSEEMFPIAFAKDLFLPLDDLVTLGDSFWQKEKKESSKYGYRGKTFVVGKTERSRVFWYNKTIFEKAGIDNPKVMREKGNWTWENVARLTKELSIHNKDGSLKQIGLLGTGIPTAVFASKEIRFKITTPEGIRNATNDPEIAFSMNYLYDLFEPQDFNYINHETPETNEFIEGFSAMIYDGTWILNDSKYKNMINNKEIEFVPHPKWEGEDDVLYSDSFTGFAIPKSSKNIDGAIGFLSYRSVINSSSLHKNQQINLMKKNGADDIIINDYIELIQTPFKQSLPYCNVSANLNDEWQIYSWLLDNQLRWNIIKLRASGIIDDKIEEFNKISDY